MLVQEMTRVRVFIGVLGASNIVFETLYGHY